MKINKSINDEILEVLCSRKKELPKIVASGEYSATAEMVARFLDNCEQPSYKKINALTQLIKAVSTAEITVDNVLKLEVLRR
jgi:hypothetical protein